MIAEFLFNVTRRSFMYDLISGSSPFHQEQVDSILWRIGNGQTTSLQDVNCNARLKVKYFTSFFFFFFFFKMTKF